MKDWTRRADPTFYSSEPDMLRTLEKVPRYPEEAQAEARLAVLREDGIFRFATVLVVIAAFAFTVLGVTNLRTDWWIPAAFIVIAVVAPPLLVWWPISEKIAQPLRQGLLTVLGVAVVGLFVRAGFIAPYGTIFAVLAGAAAVRLTADVWRPRPQSITPLALTALLAVCAYICAFNASGVAARLPFEIGALAIAYLGVCIMAGRIRRAEIIARPEGLLSLPQSIVPLLDRSHHHAVIAWRL